MKRAFAVAVVIVMIAAGIGEAVIKDGSIRGKNGLSFSAIAYTFKGLSVTIRNTTKYNVKFGGTMIFLDRDYSVIAKAELMSAKIKRHSSRRYKGFFTYGSGEAAQRAWYLEWEF